MRLITSKFALCLSDLQEPHCSSTPLEHGSGSSALTTLTAVSELFFCLFPLFFPFWWLKAASPKLPRRSSGPLERKPSKREAGWWGRLWCGGWVVRKKMVLGSTCAFSGRFIQKWVTLMWSVSVFLFTFAVKLVFLGNLRKEVKGANTRATMSSFPTYEIYSWVTFILSHLIHFRI